LQGNNTAEMDTNDVKILIAKLTEILDFAKAEEEAQAHVLEGIQPAYRESARNLMHYMALRTFDLRDIQEQLSSLSVSSLGHSEGYTLTNLQNIIRLLRILTGEQSKQTISNFKSPYDYHKSRRQLSQNATTLLGKPHGRETARIMVTMPSAAAQDYELIRDALHAGMDIARINTSHDTPEDWQRMINNIRRGEIETGKTCLIYMDLAGPKFRIESIYPIKPKKGFVRIFKNDYLQLVKYSPKAYAENDTLQLEIKLHEIFDHAKPGERIYFDDGKTGGIITEVQSERITVQITRAAANGSKLRPEKGVNLPDTNLSLPPLTDDDLANLPFIAANADIVGYSFVRRPEDVQKLQAELARLGREDIGIVLKIETRETFHNLPRLLLTAMRSPKVGVMIARGDLAVEIGFERIAEVQEEILWVCEAAHIPIIWATQVLEKLAKKGTASRAEITDAAMAARAECVMLNKGPYIVNAVETLNDIIRRMEKHQFKKKGQLRPLSIAHEFSAQMKLAASAMFEK